MDIKTLTAQLERVSKLYAKKFGIRRDKTWFVLKLQEEMGELLQSYLMLSGKARKKGKDAEELNKDFESELVDVLSHVLLLAKHFNINLEKTVREKWLKWDKG